MSEYDFQTASTDALQALIELTPAQALKEEILVLIRRRGLTNNQQIFLGDAAGAAIERQPETSH